MSNVKITDITVEKHKIICKVKLTNCMYSNEIIKKNLLDKFPSLVLHKCKNSNNNNFVDILDNTSIAHILEHLIIDCQIKLLSTNKNENVQIFGTTEWIDKNNGIALISLSYIDDIIALKAIKQAQIIINNMI